MATATVTNVRIKDVIALLAKMHYHTEVVDITVDEEEKRITINPVDMENLEKAEDEDDLNGIV